MASINILMFLFAFSFLEFLTLPSSPLSLSLSDILTGLAPDAGAPTEPGRRTVSMTWMMPLEACTSVATTFALFN